MTEDEKLRKREDKKLRKREDEKLRERFEKNYANMERVLARQATIIEKQNTILEQIAILPEIMKGVQALYQIGTHFKIMMETFQMIEAKVDIVIAQTMPGPQVQQVDEVEIPPITGEIQYDAGLAKGRVGKKYLVDKSAEPLVLSRIGRRLAGDKGGMATAGFCYTFLAKDNPCLLGEDLIDLSDDEHEIRRIGQ